MLTKHMRVDPQGHGRVGVAKASGDYMHGNPRNQQCGGVQMTQIMQASPRQRKWATRTGD